MSPGETWNCDCGWSGSRADLQHVPHALYRSTSIAACPDCGQSDGGFRVDHNGAPPVRAYGAARRAFAKLERSYKDPAPVRLSPAEAAAIYKVLRNEGVEEAFIDDRAAGICCDTSWQDVCGGTHT